MRRRHRAPYRRGAAPTPWRGRWSALADKIAYINHDIEDALRGGVIYPIDIPLEVSQVLGFTHGERINALVVDAISASRGAGPHLSVAPGWGRPWRVLKEFMFASVYTNPVAKGEEGKAQDMLKMLFGYYRKNPDELPADFQADPPGGGGGPGGVRLYRRA